MPRLVQSRKLLLTRASTAGRHRHLSAASGLAQCGEHLYVIADDEHHLGMFAARGRARGSLLRLLPGDLPASKGPRKKRKPDLEVLVALPPFSRYRHGALLALGSGSRPNRCTAIVIALDEAGAPLGEPIAVDVARWYRPLRERFRELNIEGGFVDGEHFALLQRGNKGDARNARVRTPLAPLLDAIASGRPVPPARRYEITVFDLGTIDGVPLCFTDGAALPGGGFAFSAVAEGTDDAYADGPCVASAIGCVANDDTITAMWSLEPPLKVEGIAVQTSETRLVVRVVTDADDARVASRLLETRLARPDGV